MKLLLGRADAEMLTVLMNDGRCHLFRTSHHSGSAPAPAACLEAAAGEELVTTPDPARQARRRLVPRSRPRLAGGRPTRSADCAVTRVSHCASVTTGHARGPLRLAPGNWPEPGFYLCWVRHSSTAAAVLVPRMVAAI
jgi:hypothetical protein